MSYDFDVVAEGDIDRYNALFETPAFDHIHTFATDLYGTPRGTPEEEARWMEKFIVVGREAWRLAAPDEQERVRRRLATIACGLLNDSVEDYECDDIACFGLVDAHIIFPGRDDR